MSSLEITGVVVTLAMLVVLFWVFQTHKVR
jgi:hypothetical protein